MPKNLAPKDFKSVMIRAAAHGQFLYKLKTSFLPNLMGKGRKVARDSRRSSLKKTIAAVAELIRDAGLFDTSGLQVDGAFPLVASRAATLDVALSPAMLTEIADKELFGNGAFATRGLTVLASDYFSNLNKLCAPLTAGTVLLGVRVSAKAPPPKPKAQPAVQPLRPTMERKTNAHDGVEAHC